MFKASFGTRAAAVLAGVAMMTAAPVMAQDQVQIGVDANLIAPQEQFNIEPTFDAVFGDLVRPDEGFCQYLLSANTAVENGGVLTASSSTGEGCGAFGAFQVAQISHNCRSGKLFGLETASRGLVEVQTGIFASIIADNVECTGNFERQDIRVALRIGSNAELGGATLTVPVDITFD